MRSQRTINAQMSAVLCLFVFVSIGVSCFDPFVKKQNIEIKKHKEEKEYRRRIQAIEDRIEKIEQLNAIESQLDEIENRIEGEE